MTDKVSCAFCKEEMSKESETPFICSNCGAIMVCVTIKKPAFVNEIKERVIELKEKEVYFNLPLNKDNFDSLLKGLRSYLHSEEYNYSTSLETVFYILQKQQNKTTEELTNKTLTKVIECDFFACLRNLEEACSDSKYSVSKNSKGELFCKRFSQANLKEQKD